LAKSKVVALPSEVSHKLEEWMNLKPVLATYKDREFELRTEIINNAGFNVAKFEGTESISLADGNGNDSGWKLKAVKDQNYTLTNNANETVLLLQEIAKIDPAVAQGLVKWQPVISESVYKKQLLPLIENGANPEIAKALAVALTIKQGAPRLELIAPEPEHDNPADKTSYANTGVRE
jgi:hypothetical protein